jgi:DNA polymerase V
MSFTASNRIFALVDCNNFYASCERAFNPSLKNKPIVVLSNNDGCIIARSNEAKRLGIRMGEPVYKARTLIERHHVVVFSANFNLYGDLSHRVIQTLRQFTPDLEVYSVDEAFLDLTGFKGRNLKRYGHEIRDTVFQWTGIPVSIGIAETKTLAKVAAEIAKKSDKAKGVLDLSHSRHQERALAQIEVGDVWGVGRRFAERLMRVHIQTALDLRNANDDWLMKNFPVPLMRTVLELRGVSCIPLEEVAPPRKSIICSRSFGKLTGDIKILREAVASYAARAGERLREMGLATNSLAVFIETNRFRERMPQYANSITTTLPVASDCTHELIAHALNALERIYKADYLYHKAGVMMLGLVPAKESQRGLFDSVNRDQSDRLMKALDSVNRDFGQGTLRYAAEGLHSRWKMKQEKKSLRYTTNWDELAVALD